MGRAAEAERWADTAERLPGTGLLPDGTTVAAAIAVMRATRARHGSSGIRADARGALRGLSPVNPYRAGMLYFEGLSFVLEGEFDHASALLTHASDVANDLGAVPLLAGCLAQRALLAMDKGDWAVADDLAQRALRLVDDRMFEGYSTSALVIATAARSAAHRGDIPAARRLARRAASLRPLQTYARPVASVQSLVELARVYLALGDFSGADVVLAQAAEILHQCTDLGTLPKIVEELQARVQQVSGSSTGASALTSAELRLVPVLPTHLSLPQIAERLSLSRHTVKSQAQSLYRKLAVSSRAEAVARIQELGLDT
jgi:LuxR family maltose regulon positive regulatory protein